MGLFSWELIFARAYYWVEFCVSKWVGLNNKKNTLRHEDNSLIKTANPNSLWAYIQEGLLSEGYLRLRILGLIFGKANIWRGLFISGNFTVV